MVAVFTLPAILNDRYLLEMFPELDQAFEDGYIQLPADPRMFQQLCDYAWVAASEPGSNVYIRLAAFIIVSKARTASAMDDITYNQRANWTQWAALVNDLCDDMYGICMVKLKGHVDREETPTRVVEDGSRALAVWNDFLSQEEKLYPLNNSFQDARAFELAALQSANEGGDLRPHVIRSQTHPKHPRPCANAPQRWRPGWYATGGECAQFAFYPHGIHKGLSDAFMPDPPVRASGRTVLSFKQWVGAFEPAPPFFNSQTTPTMRADALRKWRTEHGLSPLNYDAEEAQFHRSAAYRAPDGAEPAEELVAPSPPETSRMGYFRSIVGRLTWRKSQPVYVNQAPTLSSSTWASSAASQSGAKTRGHRRHEFDGWCPEVVIDIAREREQRARIVELAEAVLSTPVPETMLRQRPSAQPETPTPGTATPATPTPLSRHLVGLQRPDVSARPPPRQYNWASPQSDGSATPTATPTTPTRASPRSALRPRTARRDPSWLRVRRDPETVDEETPAEANTEEAREQAPPGPSAENALEQASVVEPAQNAPERVPRVEPAQDAPEQALVVQPTEPVVAPVEVAVDPAEPVVEPAEPVETVKPAYADVAVQTDPIAYADRSVGTDEATAVEPLAPVATFSSNGTEAPSTAPVAVEPTPPTVTVVEPKPAPVASVEPQPIVMPSITFNLTVVAPAEVKSATMASFGSAPVPLMPSLPIVAPVPTAVVPEIVTPSSPLISAFMDEYGYDLDNLPEVLIATIPEPCATAYIELTEEELAEIAAMPDVLTCTIGDTCSAETIDVAPPIKGVEQRAAGPTEITAASVDTSPAISDSVDAAPPSEGVERRTAGPPETTAVPVIRVEDADLLEPPMSPPRRFDRWGKRRTPTPPEPEAEERYVVANEYDAIAVGFSEEEQMQWAVHESRLTASLGHRGRTALWFEKEDVSLPSFYGCGPSTYSSGASSSSSVSPVPRIATSPPPITPVDPGQPVEPEPFKIDLKVLSDFFNGPTWAATKAEQVRSAEEAAPIETAQPVTQAATETPNEATELESTASTHVSILSPRPRVASRAVRRRRPQSPPASASSTAESAAVVELSDADEASSSAEEIKAVNTTTPLQDGPSQTPCAASRPYGNCKVSSSPNLSGVEEDDEEAELEDVEDTLSTRDTPMCHGGDMSLETIPEESDDGSSVWASPVADRSSATLGEGLSVVKARIEHFESLSSSSSGSMSDNSSISSNASSRRSAMSIFPEELVRPMNPEPPGSDAGDTTMGDETTVERRSLLSRMGPPINVDAVDEDVWVSDEDEPGATEPETTDAGQTRERDEQAVTSHVEDTAPQDQRPTLLSRMGLASNASTPLVPIRIPPARLTSFVPPSESGEESFESTNTSAASVPPATADGDTSDATDSTISEDRYPSNTPISGPAWRPNHLRMDADPNVKWRYEMGAARWYAQQKREMRMRKRGAGRPAKAYPVRTADPGPGALPAEVERLAGEAEPDEAEDTCPVETPPSVAPTSPAISASTTTLGLPRPRIASTGLGALRAALQTAEAPASPASLEVPVSPTPTLPERPCVDTTAESAQDGSQDRPRNRRGGRRGRGGARRGLTGDNSDPGAGALAAALAELSAQTSTADPAAAPAASGPSLFPAYDRAVAARGAGAQAVVSQPTATPNVAEPTRRSPRPEPPADINSGSMLDQMIKQRAYDAELKAWEAAQDADPSDTRQEATTPPTPPPAPSSLPARRPTSIPAAPTQREISWASGGVEYDSDEEDAYVSMFGKRQDKDKGNASEDAKQATDTAPSAEVAPSPARGHVVGIGRRQASMARPRKRDPSWGSMPDYDSDEEGDVFVSMFSNRKAK